MVARLALLPAALVAALLAASCADDGDCDALERQAFNRLDKVISASRGACTNDSDCTVITHSSACHDSCSRVVLSSSLEAISAARTAINDDQCREFSRAGCRLEIPPCVAPGNAICLDGVCSESY